MYRERQTTTDDFISFAKWNANYCYQMSLWWWSVYNQHRNTNFTTTNQTCECVERNASVEEDFDRCQNEDNFGNAVGPYGCEFYTCNDYPRDLCEDCPDTYANTHCYKPSRKIFRSDQDAHDGFPFQQKYSDGLYYNIYGDNESEDDCDSASNSARNIGDNDDDDEEDDDDHNGVEIDDQFLKFLEQSERHRQEREKRKQETLDKEDDYIEVGSAHLNTTVSAPTEQPGAKRKEEMKLLYGKHASEIMALEASLQLNFDKNCDTRQPVFWPSIPLKF